MGVKGLSVFVKQFGKISNLNEFRGKTVAIDTPIFMFRFKYLCDTNTFLNRFRLQMNHFKSLDIKCIYIFDGKHPVLKQETRDSRKKTQSIFITKEDIILLKECIVAEGFNYTIAPGEAEKLCSYLNVKGVADFVMSNDYDTFAFGCEKLLVSTGTNQILYKPQEILRDLKVTREEFLDICVASGCDFFVGGIPGIGIKKAIALVKKRTSIKEWRGTDEFYKKLPDIKDIFTDFTEEDCVIEEIREQLRPKEIQPFQSVQTEDLEEEDTSCDEDDGL